LRSTRRDRKRTVSTRKAASITTSPGASRNGVPKPKAGSSHGATAADARKVGYARVSTDDQTARTQIDALRAAGCVAMFEDAGVSGATITRDGLDACLDGLNAGDTLVVTRLDRLGRRCRTSSRPFTILRSAGSASRRSLRQSTQ
jgi:hypothetical protein